MTVFSTYQHEQDFRKMYYSSPLYHEDIKPAHIGELFDIYSNTNSLEDRDFFVMLHFSNWLSFKVKENHGFGLLFPTKEMLALVFIVEKVYQIENNWSRNILTGELEGGWIKKLDKITMGDAIDYAIAPAEKVLELEKRIRELEEELKGE